VGQGVSQLVRGFAGEPTGPLLGGKTHQRDGCRLAEGERSRFTAGQAAAPLGGFAAPQEALQPVALPSPRTDEFGEATRPGLQSGDHIHSPVLALGASQAIGGIGRGVGEDVRDPVGIAYDRRPVGGRHCRYETLHRAEGLLTKDPVAAAANLHRGCGPIGLGPQPHPIDMSNPG